MMIDHRKLPNHLIYNYQVITDNSDEDVTSTQYRYLDKYLPCTYVYYIYQSITVQIIAEYYI